MYVRTYVYLSTLSLLYVSESPTTTNDFQNPSDNLSFSAVLHAHSERVVQGPPLDLEISRESLFAQAVAFYESSSTVSLSRPLRVRFDGEDGIDAGGLRREFFKNFLVPSLPLKRGCLKVSPGRSGLFTMRWP